MRLKLIIQIFFKISACYIPNLLMLQMMKMEYLILPTKIMCILVRVISSTVCSHHVQTDLDTQFTLNDILEYRPPKPVDQFRLLDFPQNCGINRFTTLIWMLKNRYLLLWWPTLDMELIIPPLQHLFCLPYQRCLSHPPTKAKRARKRGKKVFSAFSTK